MKKRDRETGGNLDEAERLLMLGVRILDDLPVEKAPETIGERAAGNRAARDRTGGAGESGKKAPDPSGMSARYLAVFAAEITGNPHAFDAGTKDGKYLEMLVEWYVRRTEMEEGADGEQVGKGEAGRKGESSGGRENRKSGVDRGFPAFRKQRLYLKAGLLLDDVSNYALAAGIRARSRSGRIHAGNEGISRRGRACTDPVICDCGMEVCLLSGKPDVYCGKPVRLCSSLWKMGSEMRTDVHERTTQIQLSADS